MKTTTPLLLASAFLLNSCASIPAFQHQMSITTSEKDAEIFIDNQSTGKGHANLSIRRKSCAYVKVVKEGFYVEERMYCKQKYKTRPPKTDFIELTPDASYNASVRTDQANKDISVTVRKDLNHHEAWKLISRIVLSHFDVLEVSDKETGYIRTSWVVQTFPKHTVRTRVIVKSGGTDPLVYKFKIQSEIAFGSDVSVKDDQKYHSWDRVLRAYENIMGELFARLF